MVRPSDPRPSRFAQSGAFFDVDETLVGFKSMFRFLRYYLDDSGAGPGTYDRLTSELRSAAALGTPRAEINRRYYRFYAHEDARRLAGVGARWFESELAWEPFVPGTVAALREHQAAADLVVLLSGSFFACLEPIARHLGVDRYYGTRPVIRRGMLTGDVVVPMIGQTKARIARVTAAVRGMDPGQCSAYGDHSSDLPLLLAVGRPSIVGADPVLVAYAEQLGWSRLPGAWEEAGT